MLARIDLITWSKWIRKKWSATCSRISRCSRKYPREASWLSIPSTQDYDFVSRFFAPQVGINEDPVTGSAHCCLGPYWNKRLEKNEFVACQASARGGIIRVRVDGDRVYLGGQAVTVLRAELIADRSEEHTSELQS